MKTSTTTCLLVRVFSSNRRSRRACTPRSVLPAQVTPTGPPAIAPADVARLVAETAPEGREDAEAVVRIYCADAFGGIEPDPATVRDLQERVRRLKKLA